MRILQNYLEMVIFLELSSETKAFPKTLPSSLGLSSNLKKQKEHQKRWLLLWLCTFWPLEKNSPLARKSGIYFDNFWQNIVPYNIWFLMSSFSWFDVTVLNVTVPSFPKITWQKSISFMIYHGNELTEKSIKVHKK